MTRNRADALACLDVLVGEWAMEAQFPGDQPAPPHAAGGGPALTRESPDFTPLDFRQRFTGTFSEDGTIISGVWEKDLDCDAREHDFTLIHRRVSAA